jgi:carboxyl-terminal processing protease
MSMGLPDVCLTPAGPAPVPIPYPNIAMHAMATPPVLTVLLTMLPALNIGSMIPMTIGMLPGVAHPLYMQMGRFTMGSPSVMLGGMPAVTLTSTTTGNGGNNPVGMVIASTVTNVMFGRAASAAPAKATDEADVLVDTSDPRCARVRLRAFAFGVAAAVRAALAPTAAPRLEVDLRGNPGGEIDACVELLRDLLPAGAVVARLVDNDGDETVYRARGTAIVGAITVLVDRGTASAAELFAGSLQCHGRARIEGERTYGKSMVTAAVEGGHSGRVARFLLPDGRDVQGVGLEPDVSPGGTGGDVPSMTPHACASCTRASGVT